jgi:DNA (cytosine-5)-methyltransferase 1
MLRAGINVKKVVVASLFSGLGGMDLGLKGGFKFLNNRYSELPFDIAFATDFDKPTCAIYNTNFKHQCLHEDVIKLDAGSVPSHDLLIGGFPCQSFSVSAQNPPRLGFKDDRGKLFFEMCRILKHHKPRFFIAENVKGLLSANKKQAFPLILKEFETAGYYVKHTVLNASHFGIPQKRERVFIVGFKYKKDYLNFEFPMALSEAPVALKAVLEPADSIEEKYFFSEKAVAGLKASKSYKIMNKGRAQPVDSPCNTVSAHLAKVSLNSTDPVLKVGERYRMFTPREVARIQSFPENFKLSGTKTLNYKALGNAVPPILMWHLGLALTKLLKLDAKIHSNIAFEKELIPI